MPTTYAIPDGRVAMACTTYTGTGANASIVNTVNGVSFQPDFVWIKDRSVGYNHVLQDSVRGATAAAKLSSNQSDAEGSANLAPYGNVSAFNSNGFSLVSGSIDSRQTNASGDAYIGWQWKAGGTAVSNTAGSITSSVSANTTAGFSIVQFTATGATATVGHGLGVAPQMIIVKDAASAGNWAVWHTSLTSTAYYLFMNTTAAQANTSAIWTGTPSSTTFGIGSWHTADRQIAYCFAPVAGYSAFGSYTGNGSTDGPFVYLGFRPRYVMVKSSTVVVNWLVYDTARDTVNVMNAELFPNTSDAEVTASTNDFDFLSNGFKCRRGGTISNQNGATYIYMAFAENPFAYSNAR